MKRIPKASLAALAASLCLASGAQAAVSLSFAEAKHEDSVLAPGTINRGDEYVGYSVKVENSGTEATSAPVSVAVGLPAGMRLAGTTSAGWSCDTATAICSSSATVGPGGQFAPLKLEVWIFPEAPASPLVSFTASGGGAGAPALATDGFSFGPATPFGLTSLSAGACTAPAPSELEVRSCKEAEEKGALAHTTAGGHPFAASSAFAFATHVSPKGKAGVVQSVRDLFMDLPAGFVGNPEAITATCTVGDVRASSTQEVLCPEAAAVGGIGITIPGLGNERTPIYRVVPEKGYAAAFAFRAADLIEVTIVIRVKVRSNGDYGVSAVAPVPPEQPELLAVRYATLCGYGAKTTLAGGVHIPTFVGCKHAGTAGANTVPFLTNQTRCAGGEPLTTATLDSYQSPGAQDAEGRPILSDPNWKVKEAKSPAIGGCPALSEAWVGKGPSPTEPSLQFTPDTTKATTPAAYSARLQIPQQGLVDRDGLGTAHLKDTTVTLPQGLALNPSAAVGLGACSESQIGLVSKHPVRFNTTSEGCPEDSKLGTVEVVTPLLDKPLGGEVFLAAQDLNAVDSRFAIYLVIDDPETGIVAKLAGKVEPSNQNEGQITATFLDNPQVPVEDLRVDFFGGPRASLVNPDVCATYTTRTALTPWSAADPEHPSAAETAISDSPVAIGSPPPGRGICPPNKAQRPFELTLRAGSTNPLAGAHTPFALRITRPEGDQEIAGVTVSTPPGFAAKLRGVATCPQGLVDGAKGRTGASELASPSCPASSQIGTTTIGAGTGATDGGTPAPFYVKTGRVYLSGPYKGAPLSLAFVVPALAGPFDLGVQVVQTALYVNPRTAQITAVSDPIPQILDGVPLNIRDIRVNLDRPGFSVNPTNCEAMAISAQITGSSGAVANLLNRFQVGGCENLGFNPDLDIQLHGGTKRADYQRLEATVTYPEGPGYANIARAAVTLPHSAFLAQEHINTVCTRVQFAAKSCPKGSIYGHAEATTPLLADPLSGPVYLRSSDNPLPDLVAALRGPDSMPIEVELSGRTDSKNGGIRNTFDLVPDAPVSKFTLKLKGGRKSLIVNSRDLCRSKQRATVRLTAQNGRTKNFRPVVGNDCGKNSKHGRHKAD